MRFVVAGAGAVGSVFGGLLAGRGHDVLLVGRAPHMEAVRERGLEVTGLFGDHRTHPRVATDLGRVEEPADVVLVSVKSHATDSVARLLSGWARKPPLVVSLQNGLGNVEKLAVLPGVRVLAGRVIFGALLPEPGRAHVTVCAKPVAVGPLRPDPDGDADAKRLARAFAEAGIPSEPVAATEPILWEKALYNCGLNPLGALHGLTYGEVAASRALRPLLDGAIDEGFAVALAAGIPLAWKTAAEFRVHFHSTLLPPTAAHRSSMRQDLEAGRPTEVEAIGGAIVRTGERLGVPTPINRSLVEAIHEAERTGSRGGPA